MFLVVGPAAGETVKFVPSAACRRLPCGNPCCGSNRATWSKRRRSRSRAITTTRRRRGPGRERSDLSYIEGAAPGDTLVVRILKLAPNRDVAISQSAPLRHQRRRRRFEHADAERSAARAPIRLAPRSPAHGRHPGSAGVGEQTDRAAAAADAGPCRRRARRRRGVGRDVARQLRRQHGRIRRARRHDGLSAGLPRRRALLLRRFPRAAG